MGIVENSYYEHDEHGLVKVVSVDDSLVGFQKMEEEARVSGMSTFPAGGRQDVEAFTSSVEPADVNISAEAAVFDITGVIQ